MSDFSNDPACPYAATGYDPYSAEHNADPYPAYARARQEAPVFFSHAVAAWIVTSYEDVHSVLTDSQRFSAVNSLGIQDRLDAPPEVLAVLKEGYPRVPTMVETDPPEHTHMRNLVNKAFTPRRIAALEPYIRQIVEKLIDGFIQDQQADLMSQFAYPLPLEVIAGIMGAPREDMAQIHEWSNEWRAFVGGNLSSLPLERQVDCARSLVAFQQYAAERIEERRRNPQDDVLTALIGARLNDQRRLRTEELVPLLLQLLFAGHETTANLIGSTLQLLLSRPERWKQVRRKPELASACVEESLRVEAPIKYHMRRTTEPVVLSGVQIPQGADIQVVFGAANRDESRFTDPDVFNMHRKDAQRHVAFGHGIHFCLGAPLARLEGRAALEGLVERLPEMHLHSEHRLEYEPHLMLRGPKRLIVAW